MKKIKALVPFSNGTISMEQYEVREVEDSLGNELISAGVAVEISGGGSGGGGLVVNVNVTTEGDETTYTLDKTWQEIMDEDLAIEVISGESTKETNIITKVTHVGASYEVTGARVYATDSASGYPSVTIGGK